MQLAQRASGLLGQSEACCVAAVPDLAHVDEMLTSENAPPASWNRIAANHGMSNDGSPGLVPVNLQKC